MAEAGEHIQRDQSTISRIEAGLVPVRVVDMMALLDLYGVDDENVRQDLERVARDIWRRGWWDGYADYITGPFINHAWLEERARAIRVFEALVVPGLLQTEDYARATITAADPEATTEQIERWVEFRLARQAILARNDPLRLQVILDESTVRRPVGGPEVMAAQLRYLGVCSRRSEIEIRLLPFRVGAHASPDGEFEIFEMSEPLPDVGYAMTPAGAVYLESEQVRRLAATYDRLQKSAFDPAESSAWIAAVAEELR